MRKLTLDDIRLPEDPREKEKRIDSLFDNISRSLNQDIPREYKRQSPKISSPSGSYQIYAVFGGGSIIIDGKEHSLPVNISSAAKLEKLKRQYAITESSTLRVREIR